jgi:hypothetical protein
MDNVVDSGKDHSNMNLSRTCNLRCSTESFGRSEYVVIRTIEIFFLFNNQIRRTHKTKKFDFVMMVVVLMLSSGALLSVPCY